MKKFVLKMILLIFPVIMLLFMIEVLLSRVENSYSYKKKLLEKKAGEIQVLAVGSSHANMGINPEFFHLPGFNMAGTSQSIYYDTRLIRYFVPKMKNLKVIILPVSYFSLEFNTTDSIEYWRGFFYERYYSISLEKRTIPLDLRRISYLALYGQSESLLILASGLRKNLIRNVNPYGANINDSYRLEDCLENISDEKGAARAEFHHGIMKEKYITDNLQFLESTILQLEKERPEIRMVMLTTPVWKTYSSRIKPEKYQRMQKELTALCIRYSIEYYNYMTDKRFNLEDFNDNDHLNPAGAEKLSRLIDQEILQ